MIRGCFKNENVKMALKMFDEMPQKDVVYNLMIYGLMKCGLCIDAMDFFDLSALNVLFSNLNSPSQLQGWTANGGDPCGQSWQGVTCFGSSVKAINFAHNQLQGNLSDMFGSLSNLATLDLSFNSLTGDLPQSFGSLTSLSTLYDDSNYCDQLSFGIIVIEIP